MSFMCILQNEFESFDRLSGEARRGRVCLRMKAGTQAGQAADLHDTMHRRVRCDDKLRSWDDGASNHAIDARAPLPGLILVHVGTMPALGTGLAVIHSSHGSGARHCHRRVTAHHTERREKQRENGQNSPEAR